MSYYPDYRHETDKLPEKQREFIEGFRFAMTIAETAFDNIGEEFESLSVVNEILEKLREEHKEFMEYSEIEVVCSLFDDADLPEDVELTDASDFNR